MKNRLFATLSSLVLLTAAAASAQSKVVMRANIPFEFRVGNTILPAGHYDVQLDVSFGLVSLLGRHGGAMILTNGSESEKAPQKGTLVFHAYNQTHFLSEVRPAGSVKRQQLPQSKREKELARNGAPAATQVVELAQR